MIGGQSQSEAVSQCAALPMSCATAAATATGAHLLIALCS